MELEAALGRFSENADDRRFGIEGVQAMLDDGRCAERRWIDDICRDVFSVSKTLTSFAIGMVEGEGLIRLDDPVLMHLPDLADTAATGIDAMTIRHLLRMTAGNEYRWLDPDADHPGDPARDFLATPIVAEPGTAYNYRGANSYALGRIVAAVTGLDLREFLLPRSARSTSEIRSGCDVRSAFRTVQSACSCEPRRSLSFSCTAASTAANVSYPATTSHG